MTVAEACTLIAAVTAAITSVGAVMVAWRSANKLDVVHTLVNGQSSRLESLQHDTGFAEGVASRTESPRPAKSPSGD